MIEVPDAYTSAHEENSSSPVFFIKMVSKSTKSVSFQKPSSQNFKTLIQGLYYDNFKVQKCKLLMYLFIKLRTLSSNTWKGLNYKNKLKHKLHEVLRRFK